MCVCVCAREGERGKGPHGGRRRAVPAAPSPPFVLSPAPPVPPRRASARRSSVNRSLPPAAKPARGRGRQPATEGGGTRGVASPPSQKKQSPPRRARRLGAFSPPPPPPSPPPFPQALVQLEYPDKLQRLLLTPQREVLVELVITRDSGEIETFNAYRVQHDDSRGPFKGGLRYHPQVDLDDVRSLASLSEKWRKDNGGLER